MEVIKMKITWHLGSMYIFWQISFMVGTAFLATSVIAAGFSAKAAGLAVTIYSLFQLLGQQVWGPLSDKWERKHVIALSSAWWIIFTLGYMFVYGKGIGPMYVMIALMGIGIGNVPVILAIFSDYYPKEVRGAGPGVVSTLAVIGRVIGPAGAGFIADATNTFTSAFGFAAGTMLIAVIIVLTLPNIKGQEI